ncbi:hypothetical protein GCK32_013004, partial [Trichostrongylus colubriformis]
DTHLLGDCRMYDFDRNNTPKVKSAEELRRTQRSMTLSVPGCTDINRARLATRRKMSLGSAPLLVNGLRTSPPSRRTSIADAFSDSIRTLAITARRNSSPLSRKSTKKMKKSRLVGKNGICNVYNTNVPKKDRQYLRDIFTTMIDVKWRYMLLIFALVFLLRFVFRRLIKFQRSKLCAAEFLGKAEVYNSLEIEPLHQFEMKVGPTITDDDRLFLYSSSAICYFDLNPVYMVWPTTLCHVINKDSPLYEYTANSLLSAQFEIICLLEGIVESTGMTAQAKTSYLPCEILWGHRFRKLVTYQRSNGSYQIDYNLFNSTYAVKTPYCSAMEYHAQECNNIDELHVFGYLQKLSEGKNLRCGPTY